MKGALALFAAGCIAIGGCEGPVVRPKPWIDPALYGTIDNVWGPRDGFFSGEGHCNYTIAFHEDKGAAYNIEGICGPPPVWRGEHVRLLIQGDYLSRYVAAQELK